MWQICVMLPNRMVGFSGSQTARSIAAREGLRTGVDQVRSDEPPPRHFRLDSRRRPRDARARAIGVGRMCGCASSRHRSFGRADPEPRSHHDLESLRAWLLPVGTEVGLPLAGRFAGMRSALYGSLRSLQRSGAGCAGSLRSTLPAMPSGRDWGRSSCGTGTHDHSLATRFAHRERSGADGRFGRTARALQ